MSAKGDAERESGRPISALQDMIKALKGQVEGEPDEVERQEMMEEIQCYEDQLATLLSSVSETQPSTDALGRGSRAKMPSMKVRENMELEIERRKEITRLYDHWKSTMQICRKKVQGMCSREDLSEMNNNVRKARNDMHHSYEAFQQLQIPDSDILRKTDRVTQLTQQMLTVISSKESPLDNLREERARIDMLLHTDDNRSIFGGSSISRLSLTSSKRAQATAALAKQKADIVALEEANAVKTRFAQQAADAKLEAQERELEMIEAKRKMNIAEVELNVCDDDGIWLDHDAEKDFQAASSNHKVNPTAHVFNPAAVNSSQRPSIFANLPPTKSTQSDTTTFAQALAEAMNLNRLPTPEPVVFMGDPIHYTDWKMSFQTLIDKKGIPVGDKIYYLKRYIGGAARKAVEGFFFSNTEQAYTAAWKLLEERYGNPFLIQEAYRQRLEKWPHINARDPIGLQEFTDFLQSCNAVMPHIPGLEILNDCAENRKLLNKLPDWVTHRWNRIVSQSLFDTGHYPTFKKFVEYLVKEARIACNPISSLYALKPQDDRKQREREPKRNKGTVFSMETAKNDESSHGGTRTIDPKASPVNAKPNRPKVNCKYCEKDHGLAMCKDFGTQTMEQKRTFIKEKKLCFGCLRPNHFSKDCKARHTCGECKRRHPTCLHIEKYESRQKQPAIREAEVKPVEQSTNTVSYGVRSDSSSTAMIVPVWVSSAKEPSQERLTYALLDTQSDTSFIQEDVAKALGVRGEPVKLKLTTLTSNNTVIPCERLKELHIRGIHSQEKVRIPSAYTKDFIPIDRSAIPTRETALAWPHLVSIADKIPVLQDCEIGLLVGYNCPTAITAQKSIIGQEGEPCALETVLGWSIIGPGTSQEDVRGFTHRTSVKEVPAIVLKVLEMDFNDDSDATAHSQNDLQFLETLEKGIHALEDGHLEMPLPFKSKRPKLPDNKALASIRLRHLKRKFAKDERYMRDYKKFMSEIITRGDAEKVKCEGTEGEIWYIPHHGIYHPKKPDKIRIVFDCSARYKGCSLNDHLLTGPDLTNGLFGVLCRFRQYPVAIMCDIERMFHQFFVDETDRDYFRFLWWEDGDITTEPAEYCMKVHLFGAASSPGCANYGLKYLAKTQENEFPRASSFIERNFYVDDGLASVETSDQAIHLASTAQEVCSKGGVRLHKFISNDRTVMESIPPSERASNVKDINLDKDQLPMERVLGIRWCVETDTFRFNVTPKEHTSTRRGVLSMVASVFDPLGFLSPFILIGKKILQEMCREGVGWDDLLPEKLLPGWERWLGDLADLQAVQIPRSFIPPNFGKIVKTEIHHFSDASTTGYGQCSYLRIVSQDKVHCMLIASKARVSPTKVVTIPRLELTAAVVSVKMSQLLQAELEYKYDEYFWTDSKVVLGYINNVARRFHVFVANRVQKIRQNTEPKQWFFIGTEQNPADYASRGLTASELLKSDWFSGPRFLWEREIEYKETVVPELSVGDPEVRNGHVFTSKSTENSTLLDRISKFSNWSTVLRALSRLRRRVKRDKTTRPTTVKERQETELFILNEVQRQVYSKEMELLKSSDGLARNHSLFKLDPFLHDGILRVGGRLRKASLPVNVKHPVILPKDSCITKLIIAHCHEKVQHQGRGVTLNELRSSGYWVVGGSKAVSSHVYKCVQCRKSRRPVEEQRMADLPEDRVETSPPFTYCGMDCFGPFIIKRGRKEYKRYGLLFTCMCSRAVHIEMLEDMTTDAFINGLRCFIALRGAVRQIRSDQGSNFVGSKKEFTDALKEIDIERLQVYLVDKQCDFVMNAPQSSHAGGVWERQIRTVRSVLTSLLQQCPGRLDDASLRTFFYEAMSIVNSRPLTVENLNDPMSPAPLTPNHLLTMKSSTALPPPGRFVKEDLYIQKRWRRVQYLSEQFWSRWKKEYLQNISHRQRWHTPRRSLEIGDMVVCKDDNTPRNEWRLAKVIEITKDDDGLVRKVRIRMGDRNLDKKGKPTTKPSILERPVQKLVLLIENHPVLPP